MDSHIRNNVKLLVAVIGGSAVVTMGALTMAIHQQQVEPGALFAKPSMTVGATSTVTKPPTVEPTTMAVPAIKGPAPLPPEQEAAE
ncbi:MAG: hypothetical protein ACRDU5_09875 [Mycobacterium sp.]